jgi:hypothetical protein
MNSVTVLMASHNTAAMALTCTRTRFSTKINTTTRVWNGMPKWMGLGKSLIKRMMRIFRQNFALEDAILDPTHVRLKRTRM